MKTKFTTNIEVARMPQSTDSPIILSTYRDETIKNMILGAKRLEKSALLSCAKMISEMILKTMYENSPHRLDSEPTIAINTKILLLHAPSSAFALATREKDQILEMLKIVKEIMNSSTNDSVHIYTEIAPHAFIIKRKSRFSQHHANRQERLASGVDKFAFTLNIPKYFMKKFDFLWIIDDVTTTGATLTFLTELTARTYPDMADKIKTLAIAH